MRRLGLGRRVGTGVWSPLAAAIAPLILSLLALPAPAQAAHFVGSQPEPGVLDLTGIPGGAYAELVGEWDFWPNRLIDPIEASTTEAPLHVRVPSLWNTLGLNELSSTGCATYHLRIKGIPRKIMLGMKMTNTLSAARVFVNGTKVLSIGQPSESAAGESPRWDSQVMVLDRPPTADIDLVVHVSNHVDFTGGISRPILFGDYRAISEVRTSLVNPEMFEAGALVIVGFYCILLFVFRPKEIAALYFGLFAFDLVVRDLFYDEFLIFSIFPDMPFWIHFRFGYISFSVIFVLIFGFFRHSFPRQFPRWQFRIGAGFSAVYSAYILLAPKHLVALTLIPAESIAIILGLSIIVALVRALLARQEGSLLITAGFLMFFIPVLHDVLVNNGILHAHYLLPFGTILFFLTLAVHLTRSSAKVIHSRKPITIERERPRLALSDKGLTTTEIAYAMELLSGKNVKEIAFDYKVSESTVRNSLSRTYAKLDVQTMRSFIALSSEFEIVP